MKISNLQYSFIFIKALPDSYNTVMSTILATGKPKDLSPQTIQDQILNEEGHQSRASMFLNKIARSKRKVIRQTGSKSSAFTVKRMGTRAMNATKRKRTWKKRRRRKKERVAACRIINLSMRILILLV